MRSRSPSSTMTRDSLRDVRSALSESMSGELVYMLRKSPRTMLMVMKRTRDNIQRPVPISLEKEGKKEGEREREREREREGERGGDGGGGGGEVIIILRKYTIYIASLYYPYAPYLDKCTVLYEGFK